MSELAGLGLRAGTRRRGVIAGHEIRATANRNTQARIVDAAERLVRGMGYEKTMVADIAGILRMSPANVYRFFGSKRAIYEAVAARLMGEVETVAAAIASEDGEAVDRLRRLLTAIHLMNARRYTGDEKLHRMVATAMKDHWEVYNVHVERMICIVAKVVDDGTKQGVFEVSDVVLAAMFAMTAMSRFFNPLMIAQSANKPEPTLDQMIDFVMGAFTQAGRPAKIPRAGGISRLRAAQLPFIRKPR
jgi:AcrR family transcriptional regulator